MHTYDEYIKLVDEFIQQSQYSRKELMLYLDSPVIKNFYENTGKTPLDYQFNDGTLMLLRRDKYPHDSTIQKYIRYLTQFNTYAQKYGYDLDYTADPSFQARYIVEHSEHSLPYYAPEDIKDIIGKQKIDKEWREALIRTFYEGVAKSPYELFSLRTSMVDFDNHKITTERNTFSISDELTNAYYAVSKMECIHISHHRGGGVGRKEITSPPGSLIPSTASTKMTFKQFCKKRFYKISDDADEYVTSKLLYYNGYI